MSTTRPTSKETQRYSKGQWECGTHALCPLTECRKGGSIPWRSRVKFLSPYGSSSAPRVPIPCSFPLDEHDPLLILHLHLL